MSAEDSKYRPTDQEKYDRNFDRIFGTDEERRARVKASKTVYTHGGEKQSSTGTHIIKEIDAFVSHVDGTVITTRAERDAHFKKHGIAPSSEYSSDYLQKRAKQRDDRLTGRTKEDRQARIDLIKRATGML